MAEIRILGLAVALTLVAPTVMAASTAARNAALCAAFNFAQIDFEADHFSEEDRSDGWQIQADIFIAVAKREGMNDTEIKDVINRQRGFYKDLTSDYIFEGDWESEEAFETVADFCEYILHRALK